MSEQASLEDSQYKNNSKSEESKKTVRGKKIPNDWQKTDIDQISEDMADGGTPDRKGENGFFGGDINWAVIEDIEFEIKDTKEKLTQKGLDNSSATLWPENSVIVSTGASIGEVGIAKNPTATKQGITGIITKDIISPHFLARYLQHEKQLLDARAQGSTIQEIRPYLLKKVEMPLPPKPEQRRIASVLYNVDQAIQKTEEIIEQTQRVKKGLMQDLFEEGYYDHEEFEETPIGKVPREWSVENLENHIELISGAHVKSDLVSDDSSLTPYITGPEDFENEGFSVTKFTDEPTKFCKPGDVLVTVKGSGCGKSTLADQRACISRQLKALRVENDLNEKFLFNFIRYKQNLLETLAEGSAIPGLSNSHLNKLQIPVPGPKEQEKIADALETLDDKIRKNKNQKEQLQRLKKGLMQDLLIGEVRTDENVEVLDEVVEVES